VDLVQEDGSARGRCCEILERDLAATILASGITGMVVAAVQIEEGIGKKYVLGAPFAGFHGDRLAVASTPLPGPEGHLCMKQCVGKRDKRWQSMSKR